MRKLGKALKAAASPKPFYHQMCFAHAIHLAVLETLETEARFGDAAADERPEEFEWSFAGIFDGDEETESQGEYIPEEQIFRHPSI